MNLQSTIEGIQAEFDRIQAELESVTAENIQLKAEALNKIQKAWRTPAPDRDPTKIELESLIKKKSFEYQISEGIMWGLVLDLAKKHDLKCDNELPEPIEDVD